MKSQLTEFRKDLCNLINMSELPLDIKYYLVKDVFREVSDAYFNMLAQPEPEEEQNKQSENVDEYPDSIELQADLSSLEDIIDKEKAAKMLQEEGVTEKRFKLPMKEIPNEN